jgi:NAD(P)-dependent dehydrogenase (short-subunit alcohol dehydrogenase family)
MQINGQIVVISGGASGLGAATARYLSKLGATVAILDRNLSAAEEVAAEINALAVACDVTETISVEKAIAQIEAQLGVPRICINCAGIAPGKLIVDKNQQPMPLQDFAQVIQINLIGTFNLLRVVAARMSTSDTTGENLERGVIINTASIAAFEGQIGQAAYSASKGGVAAMTLPAARELARYNIRVVTIAPGLFETPLLDQLPEQVRRNLVATVPFPKRFGESNEYAGLVAHIIENAMLNGTVIRIDGALRMAAR